MTSPATPVWKDLFVLFLVLGVLIFVGLGNRPYAVPSEARYIEIPRQILVTNDWITPRLNGIKYFEKPPLFYWIQAAHMHWFGLGEFSGRFWTALMTIAISLVSYVATRSLYGRLEGLFCALILGTCVLGFASSRIVLLDVPVSLFLVSSLFAFLLAVRMPTGRKRDWLLFTMYGCAALATLTKGLIGILIPAMVIGSWIALTSQWKLLLNVRLIPGLLLFLAIVVPWHILAGEKTPEFYEFYFIHEHFERFLTKQHGRYHPGWFFIPVLLVGLLPWTSFLIQSFRTNYQLVWKQRKEDTTHLFLLLWIILPFTFFSLSDSKLIPYILPIFPAVAVGIARFLANIWRNGSTRPYRVGLWGFVAILGLLACTYPVLLLIGEPASKTFRTIPTEATLLSILFAAQAFILAVFILRHTSARSTITLVFAFTFIMLMSINHAAPNASTRSTLDSAKPFAKYLKPLLKEGDEIAVLNHYYQDLPIYLGRNVTIVNAFGELSFGMSIEKVTAEWMIDEIEMGKRWKAAKHRMFILSRHTDYKALSHLLGSNVHVLMDNGFNLLVSNQPQ